MTHDAPNPRIRRYRTQPTGRPLAAVIRHGQIRRAVDHQTWCLAQSIYQPQ